MRFRKRDYQAKDFKNPFFPRPSRRRRLKRLIFLFVILSLVVIFGLVVINRQLDFAIKYVEVQGAQQTNQQQVLELAQEQMTQKRFWFWSQGNLLFFSQRQLIKTLLAQYPLERVGLNKKFPQTLVIKIKEKPLAAVWLAAGQRYYLDFFGVATGVVGENSNLVIEPGQKGTEIVRVDSQTLAYPTVLDQSDRLVTVGQAATHPETVSFIGALDQLIKSRADFEVSHYVLTSPAAEDITLVTKDGWEVYFSLQDSAVNQANKLILILQKRVADRSQLQYIDLRYGEKVFYQ